jgi:outer membrane protein assembly factor BamB
MKPERIEFAAAVLFGAVFAFLLWRWLGREIPFALAESVPGMDGAPAPANTGEERVRIGENFERFLGEAAEIEGSWPRFRGPDCDNVCRSPAKLAGNWDGRAPAVLWSVELGEGYAAPAVSGGRVYVLDYDEAEKADALRCFSLLDGEEIWRRWYGVAVKRNHGMSRTMPAVTEKYAVTIGPRCHAMCVRADSGELLWGIDMAEELGAEVPLWYTGQCPLIDGDLAILAPAGPQDLLVAVDCATGEIAWRTPNPGGWRMSHSSVIPMTLCGERMYVYCAVGGVAGVLAGPAGRAGRIAWKTSEWAPAVVAPSPVAVEGDRIFVTAGYGAGSAMFRIERAADGFAATYLAKFGPAEGLACEQQTPICWQGRLFSIQPKDAGELRSRFACCSPDDCTKILWDSGPNRRFGLGPFVCADGKFFVLDDAGMLTVLAASTEECRILGNARVLQGRDSWAPIAIAGTRMLLRDSKRLACIDLRTE